MHTFWSNPMVIILVTKKRFVTLYICQILSTMIVYSIILFIRFNDKLLIFFLFISNYYIMILKIQKSCWKKKSLEMSKINLNRKNVPIYDQFVVGFFFIFIYNGTYKKTICIIILWNSSSKYVIYMQYIFSKNTITFIAIF